MFDLRQAFDWLADGVLVGNGQVRIARICTDTRSVRAGDLFVALKGDRFDAHDFVGQAIAAGAAAVLVERWVPGCRPPALRVQDARMALGQIAAGWRSRFDLPVIAVTGSNGKTTVKEMTAAILAAWVGPEAAFATRGNLNNDVGVPLTLLSLTDAHRAAVIELGMNHPGEIAGIARQTRPDVALVNNAQREHQEFMDGPEATARENGSVFAALAPDGVAVYPGDDPCADIWRGLVAGRRVIEFGLVPAGAQPGGLTVWADADARPTGFDAHLGSTTVRISLGIAGRHNVRNALAAAACAHAVGVPADTIVRGLAAFTPVAGRLRRLQGQGGYGLIDDSYNANPDSVRAAIDVLADEVGPRVLMLGDMAEVGVQGPAFHAEIGDYARSRGLDRLLAAGPLSTHAVAAFGDGARHFESVDALLALLADEGPGLPGTVLVKGSRSMRMERVVKALAEAQPAATALDAH